MIDGASGTSNSGIEESSTGERQAYTAEAVEASQKCPICLGPFLQESYLDTCFHKFCYNCILQWSKVVAGKHSAPSSSVKCPMCKTANFSIIHGYDGSSFHRHYLDRIIQDGSFFNRAHKYRLQCYYAQPGLLDDVVHVSRYWKLSKYLKQNQWLQSWLRREIQALMQEEDVNIIVHHILGVVDSFSRSDGGRNANKPEAIQGEFKVLVADAARPFLLARTDRFVNELEVFIASGFNIKAYDEVYMHRLGWDTPNPTNEEADGNSSVANPVTPFLYVFVDDQDQQIDYFS